MAARTTTLRLGTAVLVLPWHNPVLLAEQAATLDLLSQGRLDFGIGMGYRYREFAGFCVPMEEAEARFDESLAVILKAWTSDAPWSHQGKYWQFEDVVVQPPTAQKPHPPLWMGAGSRATAYCSTSTPRSGRSASGSPSSSRRSRSRGAHSIR